MQQGNFVPRSTMSESGIHAQAAESYRRAIETANAELPAVITFQAATQAQVENALREEELYGKKVALHLASQGLYESDRRDILFHPSNIRKFTPISVDRHEVVAGTYKLSRATYDRILELLSAEPSSLYVE